MYTYGSGFGRHIHMCTYGSGLFSHVHTMCMDGSGFVSHIHTGIMYTYGSEFVRHIHMCTYGSGFVNHGGLQADYYGGSGGTPPPGKNVYFGLALYPNTNSLRQDMQEHWERCSHQPDWATLLSRPHRQADASVAKPCQEK